MGNTGIRARRISGFGLVTADAARLTSFYEAAFGARRVSTARLDGAERRTLRLGEETVDILQMDVPGRPYPGALTPADTAFQHFALVVSDMNLALGRLRGLPGWTPISSAGPQHLPQRSGGVTAFKFRDPDGHPLELLDFADGAVPPAWEQRAAGGLFLGIDHSAISVRDTTASTAFYRSLGFSVTAQTFNHGEEQANLDGIPDPQLEVTALSLAAPIPHVELLCYRSGSHAPRRVVSSNDVAATRIALAVDRPQHGAAAAPTLIVDPDGHHLLLAASPATQHPPV